MLFFFYLILIKFNYNFFVYLSNEYTICWNKIRLKYILIWEYQWFNKWIDYV
jgi:hypothetical protein